MAQPILALEELSKYYVNGRNVVAGLNKISLTFEQGEFVAITGESGSGKSTLAHIMGGILEYEDGELLLHGKPTSHYDSADWEQYRADSVGFISQSYGILPGATVEENVISALRLTGMEKQQAAAEAKMILEEVELWPMRKRRAAKLSSGQKQRLSIARALAKPCDILIADEPTGNLDPENSDKVIRLLAKAAKDRLVILITHEFSEAENYVTRHIQLQDGRVSADARLRPVPEVEAKPPRRKATGDLSLYTAGLQVRSRPAWSTIVLLFLTLTAFAVFAFLGSFIVALDDTSTRIYDSKAFLNGDMERIVAVRKDGANMTQEDYDTILSISRVESLERFGYITDMSYVYRLDEDYTIFSNSYNVGTRRNPDYVETEIVRFERTNQYLQSVPLFAGKEKFLTAGRLPEAFHEIVAVGDESLLGTNITIHIQDTARWGKDSYLSLDMTVVGVTDQGQGLYVHEDVGRSLTLNYLGDSFTYLPVNTDVVSPGEYINYRDARSVQMYGPNCEPFHAVLKETKQSQHRPITDDEVLLSVKDYCDLLVTFSPQPDYDALYNIGMTADSDRHFHIVGLHDSTLSGVLAVSPNAYQTVLKDSGIGNGDQVSITIADYAYTERVIEKLDEAGYFAMSPYVLGSATIDPTLAAQRMQTLYVCIGALAAVLLLQLLLLRVLFGIQFPTYRTMSDLGLNCRTGQKSILLQVLFFSIAGQLLAIAAIGICSGSGVSQIMNLTKYLTGWWWIGISLIHLASTALAAWAIAANLRKKVYPRTGRPSDLMLDEEEAAV